LGQQFEENWFYTQREGCSGGGSKGGETCLKQQVASSAFAVNNSLELFKPPETTRSNHPKAFKAVLEPLTSTNKQKPSPRFRGKITTTGSSIGRANLP
jgi:hypothetical protein